jgi:hypothetical protein
MNTETKQQKEKQKKIKTNSRKKQKNRKKIFVGSEDTNKMCRKKIPSQKTMPRRRTRLYKKLEPYNTNAMFWY